MLPGSRPTILRRDLPYHAAAGAVAAGSALGCGPIEIAVGINDDVAQRMPSVAAVSKVVQRGERPAAISRRELENRTRATTAAARAIDGAVEVPGRIHSQGGCRSSLIRRR